MPRSVLITRPSDDAARTAELVAERGFDPVVAPFMVVRHFAPVVPVGVQAVLVASGNALAGLALTDVPLLAVGDVTAAKAREAGFARVESAGRDAAALVALASRVARPGQGPLLLVTGARQGFGMAQALRAAGFSVLRRVTYEAVPVRRFPAAASEALRCDALHAAIFMSGETAEAFARTLPRGLAPKLANVLAVAIGKMAADAVRALPWRQVRLADNPTLDGVLALL